MNRLNIMRTVSQNTLTTLSAALLIVFSPLQILAAQTEASFEFIHMDIKVAPENETPLILLLGEISTSLPSEVKVTLGEKIFSSTSATHEINFSSRSGEVLADLMSEENQSSRINFMHSLKGLVDIQKTIRGIRLFHFGGKNKRPDAKGTSSYYGYWGVRSQNPQKTVEMFLEFAKDFSHLRKDNSIGLGQHVAGSNATTHYYLHTFSSYQDYVQTFDAYGASKAFQKHSQIKQSFEAAVENGLIKVLKQWN
ncbi:MAG: hypothetical protein CMI66_10060 [Pedosphaera sp.]|nr:hypothetical protein [Pedosphaera sp.]HCZ02662.1 hypothetical protein [Verrucomicrobiales bacterium]